MNIITTTAGIILAATVSASSIAGETEEVIVTGAQPERELVCKRVAEPGSRIKQKVCAYEDRWDARTERSQDDMRRFQQSRATPFSHVGRDGNMPQL